MNFIKLIKRLLQENPKFEFYKINKKITLGKSKI